LNLEERLASVVTALEATGISCLVMGGHAVQHYGLQRYTNDFDLTLAPEAWGDLRERRQYKVFCQDRDRADKMAIRAAQQGPS
jgi:hypothetical protein